MEIQIPDALRIEILEANLKGTQEMLEQARQERQEADDLVKAMREQVEDANALIVHWIDAFDMIQDDKGDWSFDTTFLTQQVEETHEKYIALLKRWNKFVPRFNARVAPQPIGRPVKASKVQVEDVQRRHKAGESLRKIAAATGLGFTTVRTITGKVDGTDRTSKRRGELRRLEFDRLRAAEYRRRKKMRDALPKRIAALQERGAALLKAAKGLGQD